LTTLPVRGEHGTIDDGEWQRLLELRPDVDQVVEPTPATTST
jgi:hypothetical protein